MCNPDVWSEAEGVLAGWVYAVRRDAGDGLRGSGRESAREEVQVPPQFNVILPLRHYVILQWNQVFYWYTCLFINGISVLGRGTSPPSPLVHYSTTPMQDRAGCARLKASGGICSKGWKWPAAVPLQVMELGMPSTPSMSSRKTDPSARWGKSDAMRSAPRAISTAAVAVLLFWHSVIAVLRSWRLLTHASSQSHLTQACPPRQKSNPSNALATGSACRGGRWPAKNRRDLATQERPRQNWKIQQKYF